MAREPSLGARLGPAASAARRSRRRRDRACGRSRRLIAVAFLAPSPKHAQAARALILDAMRLVEKLQRTSLDAFYADEAREDFSKPSNT